MSKNHWYNDNDSGKLK